MTPTTIHLDPSSKKPSLAEVLRGKPKAEQPKAPVMTKLFPGFRHCVVEWPTPTFQKKYIYCITGEKEMLEWNEIKKVEELLKHVVKELEDLAIKKITVYELHIRRCSFSLANAMLFQKTADTLLMNIAVCYYSCQ